MANELEIQNLLTAAPRSLRPIFKHWLTEDPQLLRRDEQILHYLQATENPAIRDKVLRSLSDGAAALLHLLNRHAEKVTVAELLSEAAAQQYNTTPAHIGELHYYGIAFFDDYDLWPGTKAEWSKKHSTESLCVPPALCQAGIPVPRANPVQLKIGGNAEEDPVGKGPELSEFLAHFLNCAGGGQVRLTQQDTFTARAKTIIEEPGIYSETTLHSADKLLAFACDIGILKIDSTGTVVPLKPFAAFRQQKRAEEVRQYLDYCIKDSYHARPEPDRFGYSLEYVILRTVSRILSTIGENDWLSVPQIIKAVSHGTSTAFTARPSRRGWSWARGTYPIPSQHAWKKLINQYLDEWFYAAGVIIFGRDRKQTRYVRLTSFGRFWLQEEYAPTHESKHQKLIIQPDFTALLTHSGPWDYIAQVLGFFGSRSGDDNASVFHFSRESVQEALQHGHTINKLFDILKTHSSYPVPDNVARTLKEWGQLSSKATLHRDVNVFSFDSVKERDSFLAENNSINPQPIGETYALIPEGESKVLEIMKQIHALPVDYTQPPTGGLEITPEGRVVCHAPNDMRVTALRDVLSQPVQMNNGKEEYVLSLRAMKQISNARYTFERLQKLPGKKLVLNTALNILIYFDLLPDEDQFTILENSAAARKILLDNNISWRKAIIIQATPNTAVIRNDMYRKIQQALNAADGTAHMRTVHLKRIPVTI